MGSKFTPGPWHAEGWRGKVVGAHEHTGTDGIHAAVWAPNGGDLIATTGPAGDAESQANARLIAAAPDLLKELRLLLLVTKCPCASTEDYTEELYWERRCHRCAMAKNAIAKAEGRE